MSLLSTGSQFEFIEAGIGKELGPGFAITRVLPRARKRTIGPFIFLDHMGPAHFEPGGGIDVRPHPHIGLATVTYLFEGSILHRDSLGIEKLITPGAVNLMVAGSGIVHSERSSEDARRHAQRLHGLQFWVALPKEHEETKPEFLHYSADAIPEIGGAGYRGHLISGQWIGHSSPMKTHSPMLYAELRLERGARIEMPRDASHELGVYVVEGRLECEGETLQAKELGLLRAGSSLRLAAPDGVARLILFGGAPLSEERFILWNFVSSSKARLERARDDWESRAFDLVPNDSTERIPFPT